MALSSSFLRMYATARSARAVTWLALVSSFDCTTREQASMARAGSGARQSSMVSAKAAALDISSAVRATSMRMALSRLDGCG